MINIGKCEVCGEIGNRKTHRCPPAWRVWFEEGMVEGDGDVVYAEDAEDAAIEFAKGYELRNASYELGNGDMAMVLVKRDGSAGKPNRWVVSGEWVPVYSAVPAEVFEDGSE